MKAIEPNEDQLEAFLARDQSQPIVMVNLLKFRDQAQYEDGFDAEPCSGFEAYLRYSAVATQTIAKVGGKLLWSGLPEMTMITGSGSEWDLVAIVRYPSRQSFLEMTALPEYQAAMPHRKAGLAFQDLIQCNEGSLE